MRSTGDLAAILEISTAHLRHVSYGRGNSYRSFSVRRRKGGLRELAEPARDLKIVQQKLCTIFGVVYTPRPIVHGFVPGRSIATNAQVHEQQRWVFNVDLKDYFPSINFGRVRGMLMARPYNLPANIATVLAHLCCREKRLPQGAPTSPVVANMVTAKLDSELVRLARKFSCNVTRYADDITFSSAKQRFPRPIGYLEPASSGPPVPFVGPGLETVIRSNGFSINPAKVRLHGVDKRRVVTGLVANEFPNVTREFRRRLRAMLHNWDAHGEATAEIKFAANDTKDRGGPSGRPRLANVIKGNIDYLAMVRGSDNPAYNKFLNEYARVHGAFTVRPPELRRRNHLVTIGDALWVVEAPRYNIQGTAFELEGVGLVTCAHVVAGKGSDGQYRIPADLEAFQPRAPALRVPLTVVRYNHKHDVAICELRHSASERPVRANPDAVVGAGARVYVVGFPAHDGTSNAELLRGEVRGRVDVHGVDHHAVDFDILSGASGSPVFLAKHVIGVADRGIDVGDTPRRSSFLSIRFVLQLADGTLPSLLPAVDTSLAFAPMAP